MVFESVEEYNECCKRQGMLWILRSNTGWNEDEYINNIQYQLDNFIPKKYYRTAVISINADIGFYSDWDKARKWVKELLDEIYKR